MKLLGDVFTYAWRGSGKYVMLSCVVLSVISDLASFAPIFGLIATILIAGYFCAVYFLLIQSTATGGQEAPEFPDVSNVWEDMILPMVQVLLVGAVSFGPQIAYSIFVDDNDFSSYCLLGLGIVYFPMAMLAVAVLGYSGAVSPHVVVPAIVRGGGIYWLGVALLLLVYIVGTIIEELFGGQLIIGTAILAIVGSYSLMTNARILGVIYRERQEELGWV